MPSPTLSPSKAGSRRSRRTVPGGGRIAPRREEDPEIALRTQGGWGPTGDACISTRPPGTWLHRTPAAVRCAPSDWAAECGYGSGALPRSTPKRAARDAENSSIRATLLARSVPPRGITPRARKDYGGREANSRKVLEQDHGFEHDSLPGAR